MVWDVIIGALKILGSLGFFLYGMKTMSDGLQNAAGIRLRRSLGAMTTNRYTGVATGFLITALIQSSSATTVMTVGFVNAGLLSLIESAGIMMGANIGTTITGWLVSAMGFKIQISSFAFPLFALSLPLFLSSRGTVKHWGEALIGFSILLLGLDALRDSVPDLRENEELFNVLTQLSNPGILYRLMFVAIGALITIIMQSSSAAMTLTIALAAKGLPLEIAAAMILGENIGTTITAELAAVVANIQAKRSARIHTLFNLIGVSWMIFLTPFFLDLLSGIFPADTTGDPNEFILAAFHSGFNLINVIIMLGFVKYLVALASRTVPSKSKFEEVVYQENVTDGILSNSSVSLEDAKLEIGNLAQKVRESCDELQAQVMAEDLQNRINLNKSIKTTHFVLRDREKQISRFLIKIADSESSELYYEKVRQLIYIITDIKRISDILLQVSDDHLSISQDNVNLKESQIQELGHLFATVETAFSQAVINIEGINFDFDQSMEIENRINSQVRKMRFQDTQDLNEAVYRSEVSLMYRSIMNGLEKIGDHIVNISRLLKDQY